MPAMPMMSKNMADNESIESDSLPKSGPIISIRKNLSAPASTPIDATANASAVSEMMAVVTHTLRRSGVEKITATSRVRNNRK